MNKSASSEITYLYPPPLLDSLKLIERFCVTEKKYWQESNEMLGALMKNLKVRPPVRSLPCLFGPSIKKILLYADALCWNDLTHITASTGPFLDPASVMFTYKWTKKDNWSAYRFCPVLIGRSPGPAKNTTAVMVLYSYRTTSSVVPNQFSNPLAKVNKIHPLRPIVLPSLRLDAMEDAIKSLNLNLTPKTLQQILLRQSAMLYGAVPSFIYYVRGDDRDDKMPSMVRALHSTGNKNVDSRSQDNWDGGNTKVALHPTVANWWLLAQNYQAQYLAKRTPPPDFPADHYAYSEKVESLSFTAPPKTKVEYKYYLDEFYPDPTASSNQGSEGGDLAFSDRWKAHLKQHLVPSLSSMDFTLTHHVFSADEGTCSEETLPFDWKACNSSKTDVLPHAMASNYRCVDLPFNITTFYEPLISTFPVPLCFFRQNQQEHDLLTQNLPAASLRWIDYARQNKSRLFFISALLYATYHPYYPLASRTTTNALDFLLKIKKRLLWVLDGTTEILSPSSHHPLGKSSFHWYTEHVAPRTTIDKIASRIRKFPNKICILLFDGPTRELSAEDCNLLLCAADVIMLGNVSLAKGYHSLHISVPELGTPPEESCSQRGAFPAGTSFFPSRKDFAFLRLTVQRSLLRYLWYEANQRRFECNHASHKAYLQNSSGQASSKFKYEELLLQSMSRAKVQTKDALNYIKRQILKIYQSRTTSGKLELYLPYLISTELLVFSYYQIHLLDPSPCFMMDPFFLEKVRRKKKDFVPVPEQRATVSGSRPSSAEGLWKMLVYPGEDVSKEFTTIWSKCMSYFIPMLVSESQKQAMVDRLLENSYPHFLLFLQMLRRHNHSMLSDSKQEYLYRKSEGMTPLGWEEGGRIYLDAKQYWGAFCGSIKNGDYLLSKRLAFLKNVLFPKAGDMLYRDDAKSGHWYCRYSVWENGKSKRIGSFLVLSSHITDSLEEGEDGFIPPPGMPECLPFQGKAYFALSMPTKILP